MVGRDQRRERPAANDFERGDCIMEGSIRESKGAAMVIVRVSGRVTEDHELTARVPDTIPPGPVELLIQFPDTAAPNAARAKLAAAGLLSAAHPLPPGTRVPSDAEVRAAGILPKEARPSEELIDEDRAEV